MVGVAVVADHVLRLPFSDGTVGDVDFPGEHWSGVLEPRDDPAYLAQVMAGRGPRMARQPGAAQPT